MDKSCQIALVEGMYVNWTFHRLDAVEEAGSVRCWHRQFGWGVTGMGGVNQVNWEYTSQMILSRLPLNGEGLVACYALHLQVGQCFIEKLPAVNKGLTSKNRAPLGGCIIMALENVLASAFLT